MKGAADPARGRARAAQAACAPGGAVKAYRDTLAQQSREVGPLLAAAQPITGPRMDHGLPIGRALRRFRRLNGIKQGHVAEMLAVSQGSVSRWEAGTHEPNAANRDRVAGIMAANASTSSDAALKRLVSTSSLPVHLVCDATHRLLAASSTRASSWRVDVAACLGTSLWRFASEEIVEAETALAASGWFERPCQSRTFETGHNGSAEIPVLPGFVKWETIPLSDGRVGRLTTTIALHA